MSNTIQSIRGMHDFEPESAKAMRVLENKLISVLTSYAYEEIRTPIVEKLELFKRSIGEVTDIVEKEMYAFEDRGGDWLALRPEGTASTVRAGVQHGWLYNSQKRYWYTGPFFRRERPQKGRYRQFHQLGVETFGFAGPDIDVELMLMTRQFWRVLGLRDNAVELQINTLGDAQARSTHREVLIEYLLAHEGELDDDAKKRLHSNPLRVLDSKNPAVQAIVANAPVLLDYLSAEAREHFESLKQKLTAMGMEFRVNPYLVRGLDYYNRTVFEWVSTELGAQGTVCAGGRYDSLVSQMGGKETVAAGFAIGLERLHSLVEDSLAAQISPVNAYMVTVGDAASTYAFELCEKIRSQIPGYSVQMNCGGGSIKSQMKRADRCSANIALIIGEEELEKKTVTLKSLRTDRPQQSVEVDKLVEILQSDIR